MTQIYEQELVQVDIKLKSRKMKDYAAQQSFVSNMSAVKEITI